MKTLLLSLSKKSNSLRWTVWKNSNEKNSESATSGRHVVYLKSLMLTLAIFVAGIGSVLGQTTVTINSTGTAASFRSGSVNSAGTKNGGAMININSGSNRGWASFDLSTIPAGAVVSNVTLNFTTYSSTFSGIANNVYGFLGDPSSIAGATLFTNCGSGTAIATAATWPSAAASTLTLNATGRTFIQSNCGVQFVNVGFVRSSTNNYNIYGSTGTAVQQPKLTITYTLSPPCSGTPAAGTATISSSSGCPSVNFNLGSSGLTSGSGISYQWESSPTGGAPWTSIGGATSATLTTNTATTLSYRLRTTCSNSGAQNFSNVVTYTVAGGTCACGAYPAIYATSTADEEISSVTVGSMTNTSNCTTLASGAGSILNRYSNYAGVVTAPSAMQGSSVNFSLTQTSCGGAYDNFFQIYVDWNQNGSFLDAGEQVYSQAASVTGNHTVTGSFAVPVGATVGTTRMRIVNNENTASTTNYAHTAYTWGETEDYCFTVTVLVGCTGTPNAGTATISSSSGCPSVNFNS